MNASRPSRVFATEKKSGFFFSILFNVHIQPLSYDRPEKEGIISEERKFRAKSLRKFKYPTPTQPEYPQINQLLISGRTI